jgi:hypothetical protein
MWQTTRLGVLPMVVRAPMSGRCSLLTAAHDGEMPIKRKDGLTPLG